MPSLTRKRAVPTDNGSMTPVKRSRRANKVIQESGLDNSDPNPRPEQVLMQEPTEKVIKFKPSEDATLRKQTDQPEEDNSTIRKKGKQEAQDIDIKTSNSPKKGGKRVKTKEISAKIEEEKEKEAIDVEVEGPAPKKSRKRKATTQEKETDQAHDEPTPKKTKAKRKTKEEKEAEAMPLAARSTGLRMFIGAHVSGAKGVQNAVTNCVHIGGNAFALFLKSQRKWENPPLQDEHRDGFKSNCTEHKYNATKHILPHGSYLVNLAQEDPDKAKQAYSSFIEDLHRCEALGIKLYNFHPGTTNNAPRPAAIARIASALNRAHASTTTVTPLLETMAGSGNVIGSTFDDLASIIALVNDKSRIGICLDTCHLFAAGYDLRSPTSFSAVMNDLDKTVGLAYVKALHLNDSKAPFGSRRDLHANIGTGFLGLSAFWNVMNEKRFEGLPMVLETPIDRKVDGGEGNDERANKDMPSEGEEDEQATTGKGSAKGKGKIKSSAKPKEKTIEDKSIWAREIKLLESLIGMDTESEEFKTMEKDLADQGAEEREKYQEAFERKLEKEQKVKTKDIGSFFVKGKGKGKPKANGKVQEDVEDAGSPLSELSDLTDDSDK
ncbi:MAG: hypothetical protein Q9168_000550 [Polycauliona sp. 1 TL-2023]